MLDVSVVEIACNECLYLCVVCSEGNDDDVFSIDPENGNVIIARPLDWETQSTYNLTVMATDGVHRVFTEVQ